MALLLDDDTLKAVYTTSGRPIPDRQSCRKAWLHSGRRVSHVLVHGEYSYAVRIEVRLTRKLYRPMLRETQTRKLECPQNMPNQELPFYLHPTSVINSFTLSIVQPIARLFQEIISRSPVGHLGLDRQKLATAMFQLQKASYASANLKEMHLLWPGYVKPKAGSRGEGHPKKCRKRVGLGLSKTIDKYGFGYPQEEIIDWTNLTFKEPEIAELWPHPAKSLVNLHARPQVRNKIVNLFEEIDLVTGRLGNGCDEGLERLLIHWLGMRIVTEYRIEVITKMVDSPAYLYTNKDEHKRTMARATTGIQRDMEEEEPVDHEESDLGEVWSRSLRRRLIWEFTANDPI
jgi:hypothetical protein